MIRVRVAKATQVNHEGKLHGPGDELEVDEATAAPWLAAGWVTKARREAKDKAR